MVFDVGWQLEMVGERKVVVLRQLGGGMSLIINIVDLI